MGAAREEERTDTDLVGRDDEMARLTRALEDGTRFACVVGVAGVGKTALARALLGKHEGVFCSIEDATTEHDVAVAFANALGVPVTSEELALVETRIVAALSALGEAVIVADAAERGAAAADALIGRFVRRTPKKIRFVVTSQVRLPTANLSLGLAPLDLPEGDVRGAARAMQSAAVRLFVERAAQRSGFVLGDNDVEHVVAIVHALDGLPLALLLAAARVGLLGLKRTRELLAHRFELLVGTGAPSVRHRSLEAALAWSWDLLDAAQKIALSRVSSFRGGFTLEAAHAVIAAEGESELSVLTLLESLMDASMLVVLDPPRHGRGARFGTYESVRDFARAAGGEAVERDAAERHARYFASAAAAQSSRVAGPNGVEARRWLAEEQANVLSAVAAELRAHRADEALRLALALEPLFVERGPAHEHVARVEQLLAEAEAAGSVDDALRSRATTSIGIALMVAGRREEANVKLTEAGELASRIGLESVAALALSKAALITGLTRGTEASASLYERAARAARASASPFLEGLVARDRGMVLSEAGENEAAIRSFEAALAGFREAGSAREEGFALAAIGARYIDAGALGDARGHIVRAIPRLTEAGDKRTTAWCHYLAALVALEEKHFVESATHADRALSLVRAVGDRLTEGLVRGLLGHVALEDTRAADATSRYSEAAALLESTRDDRNLAIVLGAWSAATALTGEREHARRLAARAQELARERGRPGDAEAVALFACVLDARDAEERAARGNTAEARALLDAAARAVADVSAPSSGVHASDEVRLGLRVARRALEDAAGRVRSMVTTRPIEEGREPFVVAEDGSWFRLPSGEVKRVGAKAVGARLMRVLADRAIEKAGASVPASALIAAGWPGEKILPGAAHNRLYVAMTRLRRLGLTELLRNEGDGYFLSPLVEVRLAREPSEG